MLQAIIHLIFPELCAGCSQLLVPNETVFCSHCKHDIPFTNHGVWLENEAFSKFYGRVPIESAQTVCYFREKGLIRNAIHQLKYHGNQKVGIQFGLWFLADNNLKERITGADCIIPAPLHPKKHKKRGYNQVHSFCQTLSDGLKIPIRTDVLHRTHNNSSQTSLNRDSRSEKTKNLFELHITAELEGKHLVLVDDVVTTGATLIACTQTLQQIKDVKISLVAMAFSQ